MQNITPQELAKYAKQIIFHKKEMLKDSSTLQFLSANGGNAQHRAANYEPFEAKVTKYLAAAKRINEFEDIKTKIMSMQDSEESGKEQLQNLNAVETFAKAFYAYTGIDITKLKDDLFDAPTLNQLGFSYTSGTTFVDPTFYTAGLPNLAFIRTFGSYVTGGMPFTTDIVKSMMYNITGSYAGFNKQTGVTDGSSLDQKEAWGNWGTRKYGFKWQLPNHWITLFREAHNIPYLAGNWVDYMFDKGMDDHIAVGDPLSGIYGILNCVRRTIDLSAITSIHGFGDGLYEATALQNVFRGLLLGIRTVATEVNKEIPLISIEKNTYMYMESLQTRLMAKATSTDWVGSTEAKGNFIQWLESQPGVGRVVSGPIGQPRIIMLVKTDKQTYNPIQSYMSPMQSIVTSTFDAAPANTVREMVMTLSDLVVRDAESVVDIRLPDLANANVARRQYVVTGQGTTTNIPAPL